MPRKQRPKGEGTLTFDTKRKRWIYKLPPDEAGRRPQTSGKTQAEALERAKELRAKREAGVSTGKAPTVAAYADLWLEQVANKKKATTADGYAQMVRQHIKPGLGAIRLDKLTGDHIQAWVDGMHRDGYAVATIRNAYLRLRAILKLATSRRRIPYNPALDIELPKEDDDERAGRAIERAELDALWAALDGTLDRRPPNKYRRKHRPADRLAPLFRLTVALGLRRGEALGLTWRAVDFKAGTITIVQQVQAVKGRTVITKGAKNTTSKRTLPIIEPVVELLHAIKAAQAEERRFLGAEWKEHGLVFASERGTPVNPTNLWRVWDAACERAGLDPAPRIHDLRHTTATLLGQLGVDRDVLRAILGHTAKDVTGLYRHVSLDEMRGALTALYAKLYAAQGADAEIPQSGRRESNPRSLLGR